MVFASTVLLGDAPAYAYTKGDRVEQTRYAKETVELSFGEFIERKKDFSAAHCRKDDYSNNGAHYPGCTKPSPYDAFNWSDDGCSGRENPVGFVISNSYRDLFNAPCQLHDFGYRNFGHGLTLGRDEPTRAWIDGRFKDEMFRMCHTLPNRVEEGACVTEATGMWRFLRNFGEKWNKASDNPADTPLAPLDGTSAPARDSWPGRGPAEPAGTQASSGWVFTVMNTGETQPDGVWFRKSPHTADTDKITGRGIYAGERVRLECYAVGDAVGPHDSTVWYRAANTSRPSVDGSPNRGFVNAHYVDDSTTDNRTVNGVPAC